MSLSPTEYFSQEMLESALEMNWHTQVVSEEESDIAQKLDAKGYSLRSIITPKRSGGRAM